MATVFARWKVTVIILQQSLLTLYNSLFSRVNTKMVVVVFYHLLVIYYLKTTVVLADFPSNGLLESLTVMSRLVVWSVIG